MVGIRELPGGTVFLEIGQGLIGGIAPGQRLGGRTARRMLRGRSLLGAPKQRCEDEDGAGQQNHEQDDDFHDVPLSQPRLERSARSMRSR